VGEYEWWDLRQVVLLAELLAMPVLIERVVRHLWGTPLQHRVASIYTWVVNGDKWGTDDIFSLIYCLVNMGGEEGTLVKGLQRVEEYRHFEPTDLYMLARRAGFKEPSNEGWL
jgi:hypothetical protein